MEDELLSVIDVARYLKVSDQTVYRFIRQGMLPTVRVGKQLRIRRSDVEAMVAPEEAV